MKRILERYGMIITFILVVAVVIGVFSFGLWRHLTGRCGCSSSEVSIAAKVKEQDQKEYKDLLFAIETGKKSEQFPGGWKVLYRHCRMIAHRNNRLLHDSGLTHFIESVGKGNLPKLSGDQIMVLVRMMHPEHQTACFNQLCNYLDTKT